MSIINVKSKTFTASKAHNSASSCISYLEDEKAHTTDEYVSRRNQRESFSDGDLAALVEKQKDTMKPRPGAVQAYSIVQSFSDDELDYRKPEDIDVAHKIGTELAEALNERYHGHRAWGVYTQTDNVNHHLHNHIVLLNYDRYHHALKHGVSWKDDLLPLNDEITARHLTSDKQKKAREKTKEGAEAAKETAEAFPYQAHENQHIKNGVRFAYIQQAVDQALDEATSQDDFANRLGQQGITIRSRRKQEDNDFNKDTRWYTKSGRLRKSLGFSYQGLTVRSNRLGMSTQDIVNKLQKNRQRLLRQQQQERQVDKQTDKKATVKPTKTLTKKVQKVDKQNDKQNDKKPIKSPLQTAKKPTKRVQTDKQNDKDLDSMSYNELAWELSKVNNRLQTLRNLKRQTLAVRQERSKLETHQKFVMAAFENAEQQVLAAKNPAPHHTKGPEIDLDYD